MNNLDYLHQPLNNLTYHLSELTFFLGMATILMVIYRVNRLALTARQNPMSLAPLPTLPRRRRTWKHRVRVAMNRLARRVRRQPLTAPVVASRVSGWRPQGRRAFAARRVL